ncbi:hypothetical protein KGF56_002960 [Candida oxycetoniae]|uniref:Uncharacterized protein n=1 Tax=Candida oxycetoniae TaxID=497107 RepID=A0AAI9WXN9_9ASCO|nr:uncharacterized protein KGF56_002960 [Candida oxycetoniae]KAI3404199.2 hypothetical protein KGF56_002960 [Candida oxycetoniae]
MSVLASASAAAHSHAIGKSSIAIEPTSKLQSKLPSTSLEEIPGLLTPISSAMNSSSTTADTTAASALPAAQAQAPAYMSLPVSPQPSKVLAAASNSINRYSPRPLFGVINTGSKLDDSEEEEEEEDDYEDEEEEEEEDESQSIISEVYSLLTPDLAREKIASHYPNNFYDRQQISNSDLIATAAFISDVKQTLPSITNPLQTPTQILESYFSNQIFYANNLINLPQHFLNQEFDSFSSDLILNPNIPSSLEHHDEIIQKLDQLYISSVELVSVITMFNCFISRVNYHDVTLTNLKAMKSQFDYLLENHLSQLVHGILDTIIDGLYEYNLLIEEMTNKNKKVGNSVEEKSNDLGETYEEIKGYYYEIETTLTLNNTKLKKTDVEKFYCLLMKEIVNNKAWTDYIDYLKTIV